MWKITVNKTELYTAVLSTDNKLLNWTGQQSEIGTEEVLINCVFQTKSEFGV